MTVHELHDALNLLPADLITAADKVRNTPKPTVILWKRFAAMAAVMVLVMGTTLVFAQNIGRDTAKMESAVEAPAAAAPMAPAPVDEEVAADEAQPEPPSDVGAPEIPYGEASGESKSENGMCIDHGHRFAEEEQTVEAPVKGYCGNMMTTIYLNGAVYSFAGSDSVAVTDILINLDYDPDAVCRCMAEFTVDTETLTGIQISLDQSFARCERGQAALTEKQVKILREITENLQ